MDKILAHGYVYKADQEVSTENRLRLRQRLVVKTNYKNVTSSFLEKVKNKIIENGYKSDWLAINKHCFLEDYYISEWDQLSYTYKNNSGGGSIPIGETVEITILK